jgi:DNA excision repair protein ERCC-2
LAGTLTFPHDRPRRHQDEMIAAVAQALEAGRHLLVSAPSGIGKTAGALFPVLQHALANDQRVFFVTAKNTQQQIAAETLRRVGGASATFFRAREKMCVNDVYACREEFCPHLRDFSLKLEQTRALERLLAQRLILPDALMEAGRGASLCPFELALLEAEQTDVIVCDYNYVFDPQVYFRRFFLDADYSNAVLVIDEAHNLVQRAMDYYSPALERRQAEDLRQNLKHIEPSLRRDLRDWLDELLGFFHRAAGQSEEPKFLIASPRAFFDGLKAEFTRLSVRYMLDKITSGRAVPDDPVDEFFAVFAQFCATLTLEGEEFSYVFDATGSQAVKILCKDPSRQLAGRLDGFHSVIAMSATLAPMEFYQQMLGFDPERTGQITLPSPFPPGNRRILVVPSVLTSYQQRARFYGRIAEIIATTAAAHRGNYMAVFPSYEFLRAVAEHLRVDGYEVRAQVQRMTERQREELLAALKEPAPPKVVLAVQGGVFAEGVDYPGELLSGIIVISPALPQVSFERDLIRQHFDAKYGKGFEFAYLYPGMNRVIQSVGRLIRTETDRGVAVLVCRRFGQSQYSTLFPPDWSEEGAETLVTKDLETDLRAFWGEFESSR